MIRAHEGLVGRVLETGQPVLVNDVMQEPDYNEFDSRTARN
jgi:putative methionine-R-sulfoxide reductase with GAF domain